MSFALHHQAQKLADLLPPLLIEAMHLSSSVQGGLHAQRRVGRGEDFWQFRPYTVGDGAERIDWRQSARTDKYFIREREWEAAQKAYLWADGSGSMHYSSSKKFPSKAERAYVLTMAMALLLLRGGEKVIWLAREPIAIGTQADLEKLAATVETAQRKESMPPDIVVGRHAHIMLVSDFLMPPEQLNRVMRHHAAQNLRGSLVHVLDEAEEDLPFQGRLEMHGLEGETPLLLPNAGAMRETYRQRMTAHTQRLMSIAESAGWSYHRHVTTTQPQILLMQLFQRLDADQRGF